jgi:hypothetical protein
MSTDMPGQDARAQIEQLFKEQFNLDSFDPTLDFYQLGGSSLTMARLFNKLYDLFGDQVGLEAFLADSSLGAMTSSILQSLNAE